MSLITRPSFKHWKQVAADYISRWGSGLIAVFDQQNNNAAISNAVTLDTPMVSSLRRIIACLKTTTLDAVSCTLPKLTLSWTDADSGASLSQDITATVAATSSQVQSNGQILIKAQAGIAITFVTSGYVSHTANQMIYGINVAVEAL